MIIPQWVKDAAKEIEERWPPPPGRDSYRTPEQSQSIQGNLTAIIWSHAQRANNCPHCGEAHSPHSACRSDWTGVDKTGR